MRRAAPLAASALLALVTVTLATAPAAAVPTAESAPASVAVVVPITAPAADGGILDAEALAIATSPAGVLTRELDAVLPTSATIALDPMIPASIRLLGAAAPASARAWLDRLEAAPNELFLLAYSDADLSLFARTDELDLSVPLDFGFAIDAAQFSPAPTATPNATPGATPTPVPTAVGGLPPFPTTDELLAWPGAIGRIAWPADGSVQADDLPAYVHDGYDAVLLTSANVSETSTALADLGGISGLIADSGASGLLREATAAADDAARTSASTRLGSTLDGFAAAHPGRSVVLTLGRDASATAFGLAPALDALDARPSTRIVGLSHVLAGDAETATVVDGETATAFQRAPVLLAADRTEEAFSDVLTDPLLLTAPRRLALLALLSTENEDADWGADADAFLTRSAEILGSVSIVEGTPLLVTSSNTALPIRISNSLDLAVTVRVNARPLQPRIQIESPQDVTIEPGSSKVVKLDAQAITNGEVRVLVTLTSPHTGVQVGAARSLPVDLQAQWETVGLIVGAGIAVIFAIGIVRSVVLRRRRTAAERAATSGGSPA